MSLLRGICSRKDSGVSFCTRRAICSSGFSDPEWPCAPGPASESPKGFILHGEFLHCPGAILPLARPPSSEDLGGTPCRFTLWLPWQHQYPDGDPYLQEGIVRLGQGRALMARFPKEQSSTPWSLFRGLNGGRKSGPRRPNAVCVPCFSHAIPRAVETSHHMAESQGRQHDSSSLLTRYPGGGGGGRFSDSCSGLACGEGPCTVPRL